MHTKEKFNHSLSSTLVLKRRADVVRRMCNTPTCAVFYKETASSYAISCYLCIKIRFKQIGINKYY